MTQKLSLSYTIRKVEHGIHIFKQGTGCLAPLGTGVVARETAVTTGMWNRRLGSDKTAQFRSYLVCKILISTLKLMMMS